MNEQSNGGSAFPIPVGVDLRGRVFAAEVGMSGMTLRDYFAAKAMQGIIASGSMEIANQQGITTEMNEKAVAFASFSIADAMLTARKGEAQ